MKHYKSLFAVKNERIIICKASSPQLTRMLNDVKAIAQPYKINSSEALSRVICGRASLSNQHITLPVFWNTALVVPFSISSPVFSTK